jgi:hypothetical protein
VATTALLIVGVVLLTPGVNAQPESPRVTDASRAASQLLHDWFGPPPEPLRVAVPTRWLAPVRDQSMERAVIYSLIRQYWNASAPASRPFTESLVAYTAARAIHHLLEANNFAAPRFFGGVVPFPLRALPLTRPAFERRPEVVDFDGLESPERPDDLPGVRALQSLERYVGWPTMLNALSELRAIDSSKWDAAAFGDILSEIRGTDIRFLTTECVRTDAVFDYALDQMQRMQSRALPSGLFETTITVARRGTGRFALREDGGDGAAALPVGVRFADGREVRVAIDGAAPSTTLVFTAPAQAVSAAVDPDVMLVLDVDRENNAIIGNSRISKLGARLALHWLAWLQNAMLTYSALA